MKKAASDPKKMPYLCALENISYRYTLSGEDVFVLKELSFSLSPGERVALVGASGAGKSTLLHLIGLLDAPYTGTVRVKGCDTRKMTDAQRTTLRRQMFGLVYQFHHLLPELSALENVSFPLLLSGKKRQEAALRAEQLLTRVGLKHRLHHRPAELSGGEQQRVAIARALANKPQILLADEPTGSLDEKTGETVMALMAEVVAEQNMALCLVTHNTDIAARQDRVLTLSQGKLVH